jgi:hypothetical protein
MSDIAPIRRNDYPGRLCTPDDQSTWMVHLEHIIEDDHSLLALIDLPAGFEAWRDSADAQWSVEPCAPETE